MTNKMFINNNNEEIKDIQQWDSNIQNKIRKKQTKKSSKQTKMNKKKPDSQIQHKETQTS